VDFIPGGGPGRLNLADVWIVVGVLLLGYAYLHRPQAAPREQASPLHSWHARVAVLIVFLALVTLAVTSAMDHGGVHSQDLRHLRRILAARHRRCSRQAIERRHQVRRIAESPHAGVERLVADRGGRGQRHRGAIDLETMANLRLCVCTCRRFVSVLSPIGCSAWPAAGAPQW
jgi:hypothetical protein